MGFYQCGRHTTPKQPSLFNLSRPTAHLEPSPLHTQGTLARGVLFELCGLSHLERPLEKSTAIPAEDTVMIQKYSLEPTWGGVIHYGVFLVVLPVFTAGFCLESITSLSPCMDRVACFLLTSESNSRWLSLSVLNLWSYFQLICSSTYICWVNLSSFLCLLITLYLLIHTLLIILFLFFYIFWYDSSRMLCQRDILFTS